VIADTAKVSLYDGTHLPAMEVYPGHQILSFATHRKTIRARVLDRKVENGQNVVCLLLGNGGKLTGTRDQMVAVYSDKQIRFKPLADVEIGNRLRGEVAGVQVVVNVIGLAFDTRPVRLVGFRLDGQKPFVAEGVLCRAS
jgi:hypothetical protein